MLTIAIVDDNDFDLEECNRTLHTYAEEQHRQIQTRQFQTEGELLSQDPDWIPDCVFLDIVMEDNTPRGIEIGRKINERWPYCQIVYLTDYIMYASDVYRTRHTYFVTKQDFDRRADEIFEIIEASNRNRNRRISLRTVNRSTISLYTKDILLFERKLRKTIIITQGQEYEITESLTDLMQHQPGAMFCRCHNSYLVNLDYVKEMVGDSFVLCNDMTVPISRRYRQEAREQFYTWITDNR